MCLKALTSLPSGQVPVIVEHAVEVLVRFAVAPNSLEPAIICSTQLATACLQHAQVTGPQADVLAGHSDALLQSLTDHLAKEVGLPDFKSFFKWTAAFLL